MTQAVLYFYGDVMWHNCMLITKVNKTKTKQGAQATLAWCAG